MSVTRYLAILPLLVSLALAGCGSGSTTYAEGGVSGTGVTSGTTNGFGSIIVNGIRHVTDTVDIVERDGQDSVIDDFRVGEVVRVEWELGSDGVTRNARKVIYESQIKGPVTTAADPAAGIDLEVLKQVVKVDELTVLVGFTLIEDLAQDDIVEVSGFRRTDGSIQATLIAQQPSAKVQFSGVVDPAPFGSEISVGGQIVVISGTTVINGGELKTGDFVRVRGSFGGGKVAADSITVRPQVPGGKKGEKSEVEGLITTVRSSGDPDALDFDLNDLRVLGSATQIKGGNRKNIRVDRRIEVEGSFDDAGVLVADTIRILPSAEEITIELEADVDSLDSDGQSFTLRYDSSLIQVVTDDLTQFDDKRPPPNRTFNLSDLRVSDHVKVSGYLKGSELTATRVERRKASAARALQGQVEAIDRPNLTILGVYIDGSTVTQLKPNNLFDLVQVGDVVLASGSEVGGVVQWEELELEN